jgi:hypothetical protein
MPRDDKGDGADVLQLALGGVHQLCPLRQFCQREFYFWSPEDLSEAFEEEDARDGVGGVVPPLCQCPGALCEGVQESLAKKTSNCSSIPPIHLTWPLLTFCYPS